MPLKGPAGAGSALGKRPPGAPGSLGPVGNSGALGNGGPLQPSRRQVPGLSDLLDQLARDIQQMRIQYERFFNGALPVPPEEIRNRIQAQLRNLRNATISSAVDNFRLGDLEARFNSYNELLSRRVRDLEEGRQPAAARTMPVEQPRFDPQKGILVGDRVDPQAAEALYHGLASGPGEGVKFDLDSFQSYLVRQADAIRKKTGCEQVQFRLAEEEGKLKLKARPVTGPQGS